MKALRGGKFPAAADLLVEFSGRELRLTGYRLNLAAMTALAAGLTAADKQASVASMGPEAGGAEEGGTAAEAVAGAADVGVTESLGGSSSPPRLLLHDAAGSCAPPSPPSPVAAAAFPLHRLTSLSLDHSRVGDAGATVLVDSLCSNGSVTAVDLCYTGLGEPGARALSRLLQSNKSLTSLRLGGNQLGAEGARRIAEGMGLDCAAGIYHSRLNTLDLRYCNIGPDGTAAIAATLLHDLDNQSLTCLNLCYNGCRAAGAAALGRALRLNRTLAILFLAGNALGSEGAAALTLALHTNECLLSVDLGGNNVGPDGAMAIADGLRDNRTLRTLFLGGNCIGEGGARLLGSVLRHSRNMALRTLYLDGNGLGPAEARHIAAGLERNRSLTRLALNENPLGRDGTVALLRALRHNYGHNGAHSGLQRLDGLVRLDRDALLQSGFFWARCRLRVCDTLTDRRDTVSWLRRHMRRTDTLHSVCVLYNLWNRRAIAVATAAQAVQELVHGELLSLARAIARATAGVTAGVTAGAAWDGGERASAQDGSARGGSGMSSNGDEDEAQHRTQQQQQQHTETILALARRHIARVDLGHCTRLVVGAGAGGGGDAENPEGWVEEAGLASGGCVGVGRLLARLFEIPGMCFLRHGATTGLAIGPTPDMSSLVPPSSPRPGGGKEACSAPGAATTTAPCAAGAAELAPTTTVPQAVAAVPGAIRWSSGAEVCGILREHILPFVA